VAPLVAVDPVELRTVQLFLYQRFDFGRRNALDRRELCRRPRLWVLILARARGLAALAAGEEREARQQS
jgi:hypothetical protein